MHPVLKQSFDVFPVLDWLAALTAIIPNPGEHVVRYYGWNSNASRGKRKKAQVATFEAALTQIVEVPPPEISRWLNLRWAPFIQQVYDADPLWCPQCGGSLRFIACIGQAAVIEKILTHLGFWLAHVQGPFESIAA